MLYVICARVSYASKSGMERLYYYQIKHEKIGTSPIPATSVLDYQEIFYQNLPSSEWQLRM